MTDLTDEQIAKMDLILRFIVDNKIIGSQVEELAENLKMDIEECDFLYSKIIDFSTHIQSIGKVLDKSTEYSSLTADYSTKQFIKVGGFEEYFSRGIIDFESADILLKAYRRYGDIPMQPNKINTGLSELHLKKACSFLTTMELLKNEGSESGYGDFNEYSITKSGILALELNNGVKEFLDKKLNSMERAKTENHYYGPVHNGDNHGNYQQALNDNSKDNKISATINNATEEKSSKRSWLEILSWVVGIAIGLIGIYEFIIKKLLEKA